MMDRELRNYAAELVDAKLKKEGLWQDEITQEEYNEMLYYQMERLEEKGY